MIQATDIVEYALRAGYHKCGIIPVERMARWALDRIENDKGE